MAYDSLISVFSGKKKEKFSSQFSAFQFVSCHKPPTKDQCIEKLCVCIGLYVYRERLKRQSYTYRATHNSVSKILVLSSNPIEDAVEGLVPI
jgi:hypothetical protein